MIFGLGSGRSGTMSLASLLNSMPDVICFHESNPASMAWIGAEMTVHSILNDFEAILSDKPRGIAIDLMASHRTDRAAPLEKMKNLSHVEAIADVASYYLPYVELIIERCPTALFPCLKRDREETVESFIKKVTGKNIQKPRNQLLKKLARKKSLPIRTQKNHWVEHDGTQWLTDHRWDKCFPHYPENLSLREAITRYYDDYYKRTDELGKKYPENVKVFELNAINSEKGQVELLDFCRISKRAALHISHVNQGRKT